MNEAIIITSTSGTITRINGATSRMLEYPEEELIGRHIDTIVDVGKGGPLEADSHTGIAREAFSDVEAR